MVINSSRLSYALEENPGEYWLQRSRKLKNFRTVIVFAGFGVCWCFGESRINEDERFVWRRNSHLIDAPSSRQPPMTRSPSRLFKRWDDAEACCQDSRSPGRRGHLDPENEGSYCRMTKAYMKVHFIAYSREQRSLFAGQQDGSSSDGEIPIGAIPNNPHGVIYSCRNLFPPHCDFVFPGLQNFC